MFVIELKVATGEKANADRTREAIEQIRSKGYAEPYRAARDAGTRKVWLLGLSFDCEVHNLAAWECEEL